LDVVAIIKFLI